LRFGGQPRFDADPVSRWPRPKANHAKISSSPSTVRTNAPPSSRCGANCHRAFTDYLVAMKLNDGWQIVSKSYRYDLRD